MSLDGYFNVHKVGPIRAFVGVGSSLIMDPSRVKVDFQCPVSSLSVGRLDGRVHT